MPRSSQLSEAGRPNTHPRSVAVTRVLILIGALIWILLAVLLTLNAHPAFPDDPLARNVMAILALGAGLVLLALLILLRRGLRLAYFGMLAALVASALALFFDDVGAVDLVFLAISLVPLGLLIKDRSWYLGATRAPSP